MPHRMDVLYQHAADLHLDVQWSVDMPLGRHGVYLDDSRTIVLNYRLTQAQALAGLAHEVAHAIHGDRCSNERVERRADELGSTFIISRDEYAEAEGIVGHHAGALARELGVTHRMVLAWRRWHDRRGHLSERVGR